MARLSKSELKRKLNDLRHKASQSRSKSLFVPQTVLVTEELRREIGKGKLYFSVNVTMRCNTVCRNCCRGVGAMDWSDYPDMTVSQAKRIVKTLRAYPIPTGKIKIAGGEPKMHKELHEIVRLFTTVADKVWVLTNGLTPKRKLIRLPAGARWHLDHVDLKAHGWFFASPTDLGYSKKLINPARNCKALKVCVGIEPKGFLPCSVAATLYRALGKKIPYSKTPTRVPHMEICKHCPWSLPSKQVSELGHRTDFQYPTKSFVNVSEPKVVLHQADRHLVQIGE